MKAAERIVVTEVGIVTFLRFAQFSNALSSIVVTFEGMLTEVRAVSAKVFSRIVVILPDNVEISEPEAVDVVAEETPVVEEVAATEIQEEITGEDILEELSEEAELEEITEEEENSSFLESHIKKFEEEIIPKIKDDIEKITQEEKDIVNSLHEKEEISFLDSSKFSELKEKVEKIHLKLQKSNE